MKKGGATRTTGERLVRLRQANDRRTTPDERGLRSGIRGGSDSRLVVFAPSPRSKTREFRGCDPSRSLFPRHEFAPENGEAPHFLTRYSPLCVDSYHVDLAVLATSLNTQEGNPTEQLGMEIGREPMRSGATRVWLCLWLSLALALSPATPTTYSVSASTSSSTSLLSFLCVYGFPRLYLRASHAAVQLYSADGVCRGVGAGGPPNSTQYNPMGHTRGGESNPTFARSPPSRFPRILRPIFVLRFWISEGLTQAES